MAKKLSSLLIVVALWCVDLSAEILSYTENTNSATELALGYPIPIPVDSLTAVDGFRAYDALFAQHQNLLLNNDEVAGSVVGSTHLGREIWAYVIGDTDNLTHTGAGEGAVLINGGIHAREWASPEVVTALYEHLVQNKTDTHVGQFLVENLNTVLIPVLNVDGFIQTQSFPTQVTPSPPNISWGFQEPRDGRMRRKNMRDVDQDLNTDADRLLGIDLNRNNAQFFDNGGNSTNITSLVYRGAFPASEPEILALQQAASLAPESRLRFFVDVHSFSRVFFIPSPLNARQNGNTDTLVTRMAAVTGVFGNPEYFPVFNDPNTGISGTASFFAHTYLVPAWTLEIEPPSGFPGLANGGAYYGGFGVSHDGFVLPESEIARVRDELNFSHILGLYHQAGPPSVTGVNISDGNGSVVYAAQWSAQSANTRVMDVSASQALVPGTQYSIWLSFDKPMRHLNVQGLVADYPGLSTLVDTRPNVSLSVSQSNGQTLRVAANFTNQPWATDPGGAPNGYVAYQTDALMGTFTIPTSVQINTSSTASATLDIVVADMAGLLTDSDPETATDFANGGWTGYENENGIAGDTGGIDSSNVLQVQAPPNMTVGGGGGGGGGSVGLLIWILIFGVRLPRSKRRIAVCSFFASKSG